jgi:signal transduction histidine kinase
MSGTGSPGRTSWRRSAAFRLALSFSVLTAATMSIVLSVFYLQTVVLLDQRANREIRAITQHLTSRFEQGGREALVAAIEQALSDGEDSDREMLLLLDANGERLAGSSRFDPPEPPSGADPGDTTIHEQILRRSNQRAPGYVTTRPLADGTRLVVGRDRREQLQMAAIVGDAIRAAALMAFLMVVGGTYLFRDLLERRIGAIRDTAAQVAAGQFAKRVVASEDDDEFARLEQDINRMLDRIESLMAGVRHVSDSIAHNLRTPLTRVLAQLHEAQRPGTSAEQLQQVHATAIGELQDLNVVFHKLLQIAEAEAGARRQPFQPQPLHQIVDDVVELYDAVAEAQGATLLRTSCEAMHVPGDRDLMASAIANLLDNALKYGGPGCTVRVGLRRQADVVVLSVQDDGPGVPAGGMPRLGERFMRLTPDKPGHGLGLASVRAIVALHGGRLHYADAAPGLMVQIEWPDHPG